MVTAPRICWPSSHNHCPYLSGLQNTSSSSECSLSSRSCQALPCRAPQGWNTPGLHWFVVWVNSAFHFQRYQTWTFDKHLPAILRQDPVDFSNFPALFVLASWRSYQQCWSDTTAETSLVIREHCGQGIAIVRRKALPLLASIPALGIIFVPKVTRGCIRWNASTFAYSVLILFSKLFSLHVKKHLPKLR